jgi:hypothetical protein
VINWTRREALGGASALAVVLLGCGPAAAGGSARPAITMYRDPNCGCCLKWADVAKAAGYSVKVVPSDDVTALKARLGVPSDLYSCHTSQVGPYVVEGHVPLKAVEKLLREMPRGVIGIALPGMPAGSPGMEQPSGRKDVLNVVAFDRKGGASAFSF